MQTKSKTLYTKGLNYFLRNIISVFFFYHFLKIILLTKNDSFTSSRKEKQFKICRLARPNHKLNL